MVDKETEIFLQKHKPLSREEISKAQEEAKTAKDKYTKDIKTIEENLMGFIEQLEPIVNPVTGDIVFWIKQVPLHVLTDSTPKDLKKIISQCKTPEEAEEKTREYTLVHPEYDPENHMYILMEKMIAIPKKTAAEWKEITNPNLSLLFEVAVSNVYKRVSDQISFF